MKKFVKIKDVELNDMKRKELEEANGGLIFDPGTFGPYGYAMPDPGPGNGLPDILKRYSGPTILQ
jgi:hypothetical protein